MKTNCANVLILSPVFSPEIGGVETHLLDLNKVLTRNGGYRCIVGAFQPIFTLKNNSSPAREQIGCFDVHRFRWFAPGLFDRLSNFSVFAAELYLAPYYFLRASALYFRYRRTIQAIHSQGMMTAIIGRLLSAWSRKPLIVTTHAIYNLSSGNLPVRIARWALSGAFRTLALSGQSRGEMIAAGLPPARIEVCRHWVDEDLFKPADKAQTRSACGLPNRFTALFCGRFLEVKGIRVILDAAGLLTSDVTIAFVGDGMLRNEIEAAAKKRSNIVLLGPRENDAMGACYNAADVLIVPSLWQEGCGRVILEAMMCGTPIIGSNRGGIPEVVPQNAGLIIEPTAKNLAEAIMTIMNDAARLRKMADAARAYALSEFSSRNAEVIMRAYRDAVSSKQAPAQI